MRRERLLGSEQHLQADVGNPGWLAVIDRHGLETGSPHQQQDQVLFLVEGLAAAQSKRCLSLLGLAGCELSDSPSGRQAVRILLIVDFGVGLSAVAKLMPDDHAPNPALRQGLIAEVIADFAIDANRPKTSIGLQRQQEIRARGYYPAANAA